MLKLGFREYIRNSWYNIMTVFILVAMMIAVVIFMSNIERQTSLYQLTDRYLDDNSMIIDVAYEDISKKLSKVDDVMYTREMNVKISESDKFDSYKHMTVYSEVQMDMLPPRLEDGVLPNKVDKGKDYISVLVSKNPYGLKTGDTTVMTAIDVYGNEEKINLYITGVITEGQSIPYMPVGEEQDLSYVSYENFFATYSYEQSDTMLIIIPEKELEKLKTPLFFNYRMGIVKFNENITDEEYENNLKIVKEYEKKNYNFSRVDMFPKTEKIIENSKEIISVELKKYVPLTVAVVVLILTCIAGITSIKTYNNRKYYGILHMCGMHYNNAVILTGMEMVINSIVAVGVTKVLVWLQQKFELVGTINCNPGELTWIILGVIIGFTVLLSMGMVRKNLRENTPVEVVKGTE